MPSNSKVVVIFTFGLHDFRSRHLLSHLSVQQMLLCEDNTIFAPFPGQAVAMEHTTHTTIYSKLSLIKNSAEL